MGQLTLNKLRSKSGNIPYNLILTTFNDSSIFKYDYFVGLYMNLSLALNMLASQY